jgi:urease accessory protein
MATVLLHQADRFLESSGMARPKVQGSLSLGFKSDPQSGRTYLADSVQRQPLRIVRPFALEDGSVLVHLHNVSGGLIGGDHLATSVHLDAGAAVQLTTTGATRVYRSKQDGAATLQVSRFTISRDALLEYVPDPIIPFARSRFRQETAVDLEKGGGLLWWEILAPGRSARGELFEYDSLELKADLKAEGQMIAAENVRIEPKNREISSTARLGPYAYWTTFYLVRIGPDAAFWLKAEQHLREIIGSFCRSSEGLWSISTLAAHGLVVRGLTRRGANVLPNLRVIWSEAKLLLYGRAAIPPRKIN